MSIGKRIEGEKRGCGFKGTRTEDENQHRAPGEPYDHAKIVTDCTHRCRDGFLESIFPDYKDDYSSACAALSSQEVGERFWDLYWCDSMDCGVWIDQTKGLGQDRKSRSSAHRWAERG